MKAIVAFEIEVIEMDNVFKLSQDRDTESYHNIIRKLKEQGEDGRVIANEMEKKGHEFKPSILLDSGIPSYLSGILLHQQWINWLCIRMSLFDILLPYFLNFFSIL